MIAAASVRTLAANQALRSRRVGVNWRSGVAQVHWPAFFVPFGLPNRRSIA